MSWVSCVSGLIVCGVWHMMQSSTLRRDPPWPISGSWHWLQASVVTTERVTATGAVRDKIENVVGGLAPFVERAELRQIALGGDANGMGRGGIEGGWRLGLERIGVVTHGVGGEGAAGIVGRLDLGRIGVQRSFRDGGRVRHVLRFGRRECRRR